MSSAPDPKGPKSPPKARAKEEIHWNTGWWDYYPLVEQLSPRRIEWSNSSVIFSAHSSEPRILARHFSSSKHFSIPTPTPILSQPDAFDPPTVISLAPGDVHLFAYFPPGQRYSNGTACLWKRGPEIDNWTIDDSWTIAPSAGIIAASWLGSPREWVANDQAEFVRLPRRGPATPVSDPTLLLITQDHRATLCYMRQFSNKLQMISVSLSYPNSTAETGTPANLDRDNVNVLQICSTAAIGLAYDATSVLVATRSHVLPYPTVNNDHEMELGLNVNYAQEQPQEKDQLSTSDESCDEEAIIAVSQINLAFSGQMVMSSQPLDPIPISHGNVSDLQFVARPAISKESPPSLYLLTLSLNFGNYSSTPKSCLTCHSFSKESDSSTWTWESAASREWENQVVAVMAPSRVHRAGPGGLYVSLLSTTGSFQARRDQKEKEVRIGSTRCLQLPQLDDNVQYDTASVFTVSTKVGKELPICGALSSNDLLLCTLSSNIFASQVSVHHLPRPYASPSDVPPLAVGLASAILSRRETTDFVHVLSLPSLSLGDFVNIVYHTLSILEKQKRSGVVIRLTIGVCLEVYRNRARTAKGTEKESLDARWRSAHDLCSLIACNSAFDDCRDADGPDLGAIWQFFTLSNWVIALLEKIMKEAVLRNNGPTMSKETSDDLFGADPEPSPATEGSSQIDSPYLLHIVHPYALQGLKTALGNIKTLRDRLRVLNAQGENSHLAKGVFVDMVDCASIKLDALEEIIDGFLIGAAKIPPEDNWRSLAACEPTLAMQQQLVDNIRTLCNSGVISKSQLYIKPEELVDGFESLTLETPEDLDAPQDKDKDVITKGLLLKQVKSVKCQRCGGESEAAAGASEPTTGVLTVGTPSPRWRAWERIWMTSCICGGAWVKGYVVPAPVTNVIGQ
ncbi:hypothetical protein CYLTODRAFT_418183 [Cylindrobasidium torrendii FP15055 ss-10]|uniref:Mediator complex subunit 16 C-terminal domain-containing protein n=1 Tax=Cylindrobasidium torrendii FP15055 ss-10 TaxID=1314674 RepID=A0A0D7BPW9_9AGAR|nr:hypothetical protein CYLTODRAFT_418183 [Cylindrobasidium torrendii FP15055 ss-10]